MTTLNDEPKLPENITLDNIQKFSLEEITSLFSKELKEVDIQRAVDSKGRNIFELSVLSSDISKVQKILDHGIDPTRIGPKFLNNSTKEIRDLIFVKVVKNPQIGIKRVQSFLQSYIMATADSKSEDDKNKIKDLEVLLRRAQADAGAEIRSNRINKILNYVFGGNRLVTDKTRDQLREEQIAIGKVLRSHRLTNVTDQTIDAVSEIVKKVKKTVLGR